MFVTFDQDIDDNAIYIIGPRTKFDTDGIAKHRRTDYAYSAQKYGANVIILDYKLDVKIEIRRILEALFGDALEFLQQSPNLVVILNKDEVNKDVIETILGQFNCYDSTTNVILA